MNTIEYNNETMKIISHSFRVKFIFKRGAVGRKDKHKKNNTA